MPSRERLDRLWTSAEQARDRGHYRLARRLLRILVKHDPAPPVIRHTLLDVIEVRGLGPDWKFISMSNAKLDRLYAADDDDPAAWVGWDEPDYETISDEDLLLYSFDIQEGEDAADQIEERLTRRRRGKERWKTR